MKIYDEENQNPYEDDDEDYEGYSIDEKYAVFDDPLPEPDPETVATPIPENEQTVILFAPQVAGLADGKELALHFADGECELRNGAKRVGCFKAAYVKKLCVERGGQCARAYYKADIPPMVRIVFGDGAPIPLPLPDTAE